VVCFSSLALPLVFRRFSVVLLLLLCCSSVVPPFDLHDVVENFLPKRGVVRKKQTKQGVTGETTKG